MQLNYSVRQGKNRPGQIDGIVNHENTITRTNPALAQQGTLTVGGTAADGVYSATFTPELDPDNGKIVVTFTREDGEANAAIGAAIFADATKKFILQAEVTYNGTTVVTIKQLNTDIAYTVETAAPGGATFVWAQTQAPGGTKIPFGRFLVGDGTGENCKVVTGATVVGDIIGVSAANYQTKQASPTVDPTIEDGYDPGREVSVYGVGPIDVLTEQAVTPADTVFVRIVASGNNTKLGIVRKDADGGNAITATTIARFTDSAAAGETVRVKVFIPQPKP